MESRQGTSVTDTTSIIDNIEEEHKSAVECPAYLLNKPLSEMTDNEKNLYYAHLMQSVKETQRKAKETLEKNAIAKVEIENTLKASREVDERYEKFKSDFGVAIN